MEVSMTGSTGALKPLIGMCLARPCPLQRSGLLPLRRKSAGLVPFAAVSSSLQEQTDERQRDNENAAVAVGSESVIKMEPARKLVQQRRKAQWSKGDGPGEYGGPPLDLRIRKSWGGNPVEDPLTSAGDYIWKKKWQPFLEATSSDTVAVQGASNAKEPDSGFLSLSRAIRLDSMDVDLTAELNKPSKYTLQQQVEEALRQDASAVKSAQDGSPRWRMAPTRREEERWARGRKAAAGGSEVLAREVARAQIDPVEAAEKQRLWYAELKRNLQLWTLGIGGLGTACAYFTYSPEIAGSYGAGLIGALFYIRMLGTSVDGLGASGPGAARQALGSPRMLIPVALVMVYNRWNGLLVPEYGFTHLDLIPMLLGFFTYKAATLVETFKELLPPNDGKSMT